MKGNLIRVRIPAENVQIHRLKIQERSQGDGEEQECKGKAVIHELKNDAETCDQLENSDDKENSPGVVHNKLEVQLPEISHLAHRLHKCSILSSPDMSIINPPPEDIDAKEKFQLVPKRYYNVRHSNKSGTSLTLTAKKKEPKFVPYEPYKGCVKPILYSSPVKHQIKDSIAAESRPVLKMQSEFIQACGVKLDTIVMDFETERTKWEANNMYLEKEKTLLEAEIHSLNSQLSSVHHQLSIQCQVNDELKKLLVASLGEDLQGRVQCLTEDKARMASMIRKYSEKVDRDYEEKEKMSIQCDVWRSKFLGTSVLLEELARSKCNYIKRLEEAREAIRVMLQERQLSHHNLVTVYRHLYQIREAFDPFHAESSGGSTMESSDCVSLSVQAAVMAEHVRDRLLGNLGRAVGCPDLNLPEQFLTPGEKIAQKVLEQPLIDEKQPLNYIYIQQNSIMPRFHPHSKYERLTVNCCAHCNGEIKVL